MRLDPHIDRATWDIALATRPAALQQDWCYGQAMASLGAGVKRVGLLDGQTLVGLAQFTNRRMGGLVSMAACTRGPVWLGDVDAETRADGYRALKSGLDLGWPRVTLVSPDETVPAGVNRMKRVMTGYSTVMLDLRPSEDKLRAGLHPKWRNSLKAAGKVRFDIVRNGTKPAQLAWLMGAEEAQRQDRGYRATPAALVPAYLDAKGDRDAALVLRADIGKTKAAAMLFLVHGCAATYHMGWLNREVKAPGAHNLLMWDAIRRLREMGVLQLDLGGVNTVSGAGIARFKIGTGGEVVTRGGSWT